MELSPLARERLEKAGDFSQAEKEKMRLEGELTSIMADFFTKKLDAEGLWQRLKDRSSEAIVKETQLRLAHTLSVGGSDVDFERYTGAVMSLETLKKHNGYAVMEAVIDQMKKLRRNYVKEKESAFASVKERMGSQLMKAARQMAANNPRNSAIDIEGSIEASVKASPQWRDFIVKFENNYSSQFEALQAKLAQLI